MLNTLSVNLRCSRHRTILVWDAELQMWRCPVTGCYYIIPGDPPVVVEQ
jgi:hypothetical protein